MGEGVLPSMEALNLYSLIGLLGRKPASFLIQTEGKEREKAPGDLVAQITVQTAANSAMAGDGKVVPAILFAKL